MGFALEFFSVNAKSMPMNQGLNFVYVGIGGATGACLRYSLSLWLARGAAGFPWATVTANLAGALAAGIIATWFWSRGEAGTPLQLLLVAGFLGGFTTFSAFSVETLRLFSDGHQGLAALNIAVNVLGSLLAVFLGAVLARWFLVN